MLLEKNNAGRPSSASPSSGSAPGRLPGLPPEGLLELVLRTFSSGVSQVATPACQVAQPGEPPLLAGTGGDWAAPAPGDHAGRPRNRNGLAAILGRSPFSCLPAHRRYSRKT